MGRDRENEVIRVELRREGPSQFDGVAPFEIRIPSLTLQKIVQEFTLTNRWWTAYSVDKLEHILRFYKIIPEKMYYRETEVGNPTTTLSDTAVFGMHYSDFEALAHPNDFPIFKSAKALPASVQRRLPSGK